MNTIVVLSLCYTLESLEFLNTEIQQGFEANLRKSKHRRRLECALTQVLLVGFVFAR